MRNLDSAAVRGSANWLVSVEFSGVEIYATETGIHPRRSFTGPAGGHEDMGASRQAIHRCGREGERKNDPGQSKNCSGQVRFRGHQGRRDRRK